jgi:hypothetical protein
MDRTASMRPGPMTWGEAPTDVSFLTQLAMDCPE